MIDRYIQGYEMGYNAGLRARQNEVDFLLNLLDRKETDREEQQNVAVKRFLMGLKRGCNNGLE